MNKVSTTCGAFAWSVLAACLLGQDAAPASGRPAADRAQNGAPAEAAGLRARGSPAIFAVDLAKCFEQSPKWIKLKAELEAMNKAMTEKVNEATKRLDELRGTIQVMAQDSEERRELEMQFELRQQERAMFAKAANERIDLATARAQIVVYEIIEQAIAKVAKARGALLVFRMQEFEVPTTTPDKLTPRGVQNRIIPLERRNVWYAAPEADLTGDVIKELLVWPDDTPAAPQKAPAPPSSPRTGGGE